MKITLYGGPAHGQPAWIDDDGGCGRLEVLVKPPVPTPMSFRLDDPPDYRALNRETTSYYVKQYVIQAETEAGALVYREKWVGVWEHGGLMDREQYELEREMRDIPWKWVRKPNFLTEFDQWFEYTLAEIGWQPPLVRYF
ncbi:MAG: hypothetical protein ACYS7Y_36480 [Planctomycetota bacterium]|jgi:hypothetical protein